MGKPGLSERGGEKPGTGVQPSPGPCDRYNAAMIEAAVLASRGDHASVRYRTLQYRSVLESSGIGLHFFPIPPSLGARLRLFRSLKRFDAVILQRKLFNYPNFWLLRRYARKLIYDLDDALFLKDSRDNAATSRTRSMRFRRTAARADFVLAGNAYILDTVRRYNRQSAVIPTVVDLERYPTIKDHGKAGPFRPVWIGGRSTLFYLEELLPGLERLAEEIHGFAIRVISDRFPERGTIAIEERTWAEATEVDDLLDADCGLMPLPDDAWTRGKCGLKLIQYGAAGLPAVASPVGVNPEIVPHGETGFLASTPAEWCDAISMLWKEPELRKTMGKEARRRIADHFSTERYAPVLTNIIETLVEGQRCGAG